MITLRVGDDIFEAPALELMSRRIAASSGDARRILEMAVKSIDHCSDALSEKEKKSIVVSDSSFAEDGTTKISLPLVKITHVMKVVREGNPKLAETIQGQPRAAQVVLCVAVTLSHFMSAKTVITQGQLLEYCRASSRYGLLEGVCSSDFSDIVKNLSDAGLLLLGDDEGNSFSFDANHVPIKIGVQLDDVECALETSLLAQPFYASVVQHVKENFK